MSHLDFVHLIRRVFAPTDTDRSLALWVDLPDETRPDHAAWADRRALAFEWARSLDAVRRPLGLERVDIVLLRNAHNNNADFPPGCWVLDAADLGGDSGTTGEATPPPGDWRQLDPAAQVPVETVLPGHDIYLALTEYSATAPLKLAARRHGFRAASMPRFSRAMIPALDLDWVEVDRRCRKLKHLVDRADTAHLRFLVDGEMKHHELRLDLRHRTGQASGGLIQERGTAGNLPSGETYIVPYEGERPGDPSRTEGVLPVQLPCDPGGTEVVLYRIAGNRAREVSTTGPASRREAERLASEPAYGNLAELGLGVLSAWGVEPLGEILVDEKLGLHIAFGRSDHFGGQVGAADFSTPEAVVHIDRVYLPATQPAVRVPAVDLEMPGGERVALMRNGLYVIDWL